MRWKKETGPRFTGYLMYSFCDELIVAMILISVAFHKGHIN